MSFLRTVIGITRLDKIRDDGDDEDDDIKDKLLAELNQCSKSWENPHTAYDRKYNS
jgi:hypothetical protein